MLVLALLLIEKAMREYGTGQILAHLKSIPARYVLVAICMTVLCHIVLTGYDALAVKSLGLRLPYRRTAMAAFLGFAFSHSLGFSMLSGAPIRYRLYSAWGVPTKHVASIVAFNSLSWCLGLMTVCGSALALCGLQHALPASTAVFPWRLLGLLCLSIVAGYLFLCYRGRAFRLIRWNLPLPNLPMALLQVGVACADWGLTGAVLYVLLPPSGISFGRFLAIFSLAQTAGLISQVPAGLGILDSAVISLLPSSTPADSAISSLLAFRLVYTLSPLVLALALLVAFEAGRRLRELGRMKLATSPFEKEPET